MASTLRAGAAGTAAVALLGFLPGATADPLEPLAIAIVLVDDVPVPEAALTRAKSEAARIYRSLGVTLIWSDTIVSSVRPQMSVKIVSTPFCAGLAIPGALAIKAADSRVLGVAPGHKERRDLAVWAFYERIEDAAKLLGLDSGLLLGHVIAHEMGHVLLPYDFHSEAGLMRAGWDKSQAANAVMGSADIQPGRVGADSAQREGYRRQPVNQRIGSRPASVRSGTARERIDGA